MQKAGKCHLPDGPGSSKSSLPQPCLMSRDKGPEHLPEPDPIRSLAGVARAGVPESTGQSVRPGVGERAHVPSCAWAWNQEVLLGDSGTVALPQLPRIELSEQRSRAAPWADNGTHETQNRCPPTCPGGSPPAPGPRPSCPLNPHTFPTSPGDRNQLQERCSCLARRDRACSSPKSHSVAGTAYIPGQPAAGEQEGRRGSRLWDSPSPLGRGRAAEPGSLPEPPGVQLQYRATMLIPPGCRDKITLIRHMTK